MNQKEQNEKEIDFGNMVDLEIDDLKEERLRTNISQKMDFVFNSIVEPCDVERDLEDEQEQYCDTVEEQEHRWGGERGGKNE